MHYKIYASVLITLAFITSVAHVSAQTIGDATSQAASYLSSQSTTASTAMALSAYGQSVDVAFLKSADTSTAIGITKPIMAIVAAGEDPRTYPDTDLVAALKAHFDGTQFGSDTQLNDDMWAIFALSASGEADSSEVSAAQAFILANQNTDGGWSWGVGESSDTDDTAAAVMALLESGLSGDHGSIVDAVAYIKGNQNTDGGFYSNPAWGTDSNSSSDAWVLAMINALGEDAGSWSSGGYTPIDHILSLQDTDGGFWWVTPGTSDFNNKASTSDVLIALLGKSYPVAKMSKSAAPLVSYRIEGSLSQLCAGEVNAETALEVIENASSDCGYTYTIQDTDWGPYLSEVAGDAAEGLSGWLYFVNWQSGNVGAADYILSSGDFVLWNYGEWGVQPMRLTLDAHDTLYTVGEIVGGIVESYGGGSWTALKIQIATHG